MTKQTEPYVPVDCGLHSEYELAIMQRQLLTLRWQDENGTLHDASLLPVDLLTRDSQEFLIAHDKNNIRYEIRLDRIIKTAHELKN